MTEVIRHLVREISQRASSNAQTRNAAGNGSLGVTVTVPHDVSSAQRKSLETHVRRLLVQRSVQVGLAQAVDVKVAFGPARPEHEVLVSIDGRPAALVRTSAPGGVDWPATVTHSIDRIILRRLSLLLRPSHRVEHADRLRRVVDDNRPNLYTAVPGLLLDNGISLANPALDARDAQLTPGQSSNEICEALVASAASGSITLQVSESTLKMANADGATSVLRARESMYAATGLQFPDIQLELIDGSADIRIKLNDIWLTSGLRAETATWDQVVKLIRRLLQEHGAWFVNMNDIVRLRSQLSAVVPDLVHLSASRYPDSLLAAIVRSLVKNGDSVRNFPRILWLLLEYIPAQRRERSSRMSGSGGNIRFEDALLLDPAQVPHDPDLLAAHVRRLSAEDAWRGGTVELPPNLCVLPADLETELSNAGNGELAPELRLRVMDNVASRPSPVLVVHSPRVFRHLRDIADVFEHPPRVIMSWEVPPDVSL